MSPEPARLPDTKEVFRSSQSGRFVTAAYAAAHPDVTERDTVPAGSDAAVLAEVDALRAEWEAAGSLDGPTMLAALSACLDGPS